jgi:hypothetical protein
LLGAWACFDIAILALGTRIVQLTCDIIILRVLRRLKIGIDMRMLIMEALRVSRTLK